MVQMLGPVSHSYPIILGALAPAEKDHIIVYFLLRLLTSAKSCEGRFLLQIWPYQIKVPYFSLPPNAFEAYSTKQILITRTTTYVPTRV